MSQEQEKPKEADNQNKDKSKNEQEPEKKEAELTYKTNPNHPLKARNLSMGQKESISKTVTKEDIIKYSEITGDKNPLHFDEAYAAKTKFGKLVAQGGITAGLLNALVAMKMPGNGTVFLNQNLQYTKPVYIGDTVTATATITKLHAKKPVTTIAVEIKNQNEEVVLHGTCVCYTFVV
eukprot:144659_1